MGQNIKVTYAQDKMERLNGESRIFVRQLAWVKVKKINIHEGPEGYIIKTRTSRRVQFDFLKNQINPIPIVSEELKSINRFGSACPFTLYHFFNLKK